MTKEQIAALRRVVRSYYRLYGRHDLPWRVAEPDGSFDPYKILLSELMLQQTQVPRVIPKFNNFITVFPSLEVLAQAPLSEVLRQWSGLGYNRRAKFLLQTAGIVVSEHRGVLPRQHKDLIALPGIGSNTAGAIMAYAFNEPVAFIETNIRTVYIHRFFEQNQKISDIQLLPLIKASLPPTDIRTWYWALMDYGTHLKKTVGNVSRNSASYVRQSAFQGSKRQIRGQVLKFLANQYSSTLPQLREHIRDDRLQDVLNELLAEGFIESSRSRYRLRT